MPIDHGLFEHLFAPTGESDPESLNFEAAGKAVLAFLRERIGFDLWMITRVEADDWIVLQADDQGYGVSEGSVFRWADSFCSRMVQGQGPSIAPSSALVPAYREAPIAEQVPIKAYVGQPLRLADGQLFGTLCAIHPETVPEHIEAEEGLIALLSALLSAILEWDLRTQALRRHADRLEVAALTDSLTGLYNRRGWDKIMAAEEDRCRRYGHPAAVVVIDVDGLKQVNDELGHSAGDALIARTADALRAATRSSDTVARLGGDEFGILSVECTGASAQRLVERLRHALDEADVSASIGLAPRSPKSGLAGAQQCADELMYAEKEAKPGRQR